MTTHGRALTLIALTILAVAPAAKAETPQVTNSSPITINALGSATPYPATIDVSGIPGTVVDVNVRMNDLNHGFSEDIDAIVVSPAGRGVVVMSDVPGAAANADVTFDDEAPGALPGSPVVTGSYRPTNIGPGDIFPGFFGPTSPTLAGFDGTTANGQWQLRIQDDVAGSGGGLSEGWTLEIAACDVRAADDVTQANDISQAFATVNYPAPTSVGSCGVVSCFMPSGSIFPVGETVVTCSGDGGASDTLRVRVNDTQVPNLTPPADRVVANDPGRSGARVNYPAPVVSDNSAGFTSGCVPASGSFFGLGTSEVTCTARDASGNTNIDTFDVTVTDGEAPRLTVPADLDAYAPPGSATAAVLYLAGAADNSGTDPVPACSHASGGSFPLGATTITCSATDGSGNSVSKSFKVTVRNTPVQGGGTGGSGGGSGSDKTAPAISKLKAARGKLTFDLSENAKISLALETRQKGKFAPRGTSVLSAKKGANRAALPKKPGSYRVRVTATDAAGNSSKPSTKTFRVIKKKK